ncbi:hypothetical protein BgiBS90_009715 [Biomphalaria glabrata]|nr:hypothetical protein BgiBS90_009715 [Biomphalaria glabrata]
MDDVKHYYQDLGSSGSDLIQVAMYWPDRIAPLPPLCYINNWASLSYLGRLTAHLKRIVYGSHILRTPLKKVFHAIFLKTVNRMDFTPYLLGVLCQPLVISTGQRWWTGHRCRSLQEQSKPVVSFSFFKIFLYVLTTLFIVWLLLCFEWFYEQARKKKNGTIWKRLSP